MDGADGMDGRGLVARQPHCAGVNNLFTVNYFPSPQPSRRFFPSPGCTLRSSITSTRARGGVHGHRSPGTLSFGTEEYCVPYIPDGSTRERIVIFLFFIYFH